MAKQAEITFAVGTAECPFSATWKLKVRNREVYLGARTLMGQIKVSLHSGGEWLVAWTAESGLRPAQGSRTEKRCRRPAPFREGWTQGPSVVVPATDVTAPIPCDAALPASKKIKWFAAPATNRMVVFTILFAAEGATDTDSVLLPGDEIVGTAALSTGETVIVCKREAALPNEDAERIRNLASDLRVHYANEPAEFGASLLEIGDSPVGCWTLFDISLGREHLRIDPPSEL